MESLQHGVEGFERLGEVLSILKETSGVEPVVVFEATGNYHRGLAGYLKRSG
jgi:transposase